MPQDPTDDKSTLVQVMAWCRQAPSHYLNQCWPRSLSSYGVTRPQWVKLDWPDLVISGSLNGMVIHVRFVSEPTVYNEIAYLWSINDIRSNHCKTTLGPIICVLCHIFHNPMSSWWYSGVPFLYGPTFIKNCVLYYSENVIAWIKLYYLE